MRARRAALAALAAATVVSGCGAGGEDDENRGAAGETLALAKLRCSDWRVAEVERRGAIVAQLGDVARGRIAGQPGPTLPPAEAEGLFERACSHDFAAAFLLYDIYNRAAAFQSIPAAG